MYKKILFSFLLSVFVSFLFVANQTEGEGWGDYWRLEGDRLVAIQDEILQFCLSDGATCVTPPVASGGGDVFGDTISELNQITKFSTTDGKHIKAAIGFYNKDDGTVGIGTDNPTVPLDVVGQIKASVGITSPKIYPIADSAQGFQINKANGNTVIVNVDTTNQRVGIGETTPLTILHIGDVTEGNHFITLGKGENQSGLNFTSGAGVIGEVKMDVLNDVYFSNLVTGRNIILEPTATGNVGIGTTDPQEKLDVAGNFLVGGVDFFVNDATGNVGIGTVTPSSALDIIGNLEVGETDFFVDATSGNVGIGTITPVEALDVAGNIRLTGDVIQVGFGNGIVTTGNIRNTLIKVAFDLIGDLSDFVTIGVPGSSGQVNAIELLISNKTGGEFIFDNGVISTSPSTVERASLNIPVATAEPTTPNEGDVWFDGNGMNAYYNGMRKHFTPDNVVNVLSLADFPAPVAGYIPLENKRYNILEEITLVGPAYKGFVVNNNVEIIGSASIIYVNQDAVNDALFTGNLTGTSLLFIKDLQVINGDSSGRLFDLKGDATGVILFNNFLAAFFEDLGTVDTISYFGIVANYIYNVTDGLVFNNNNALAVAYHRFNNWSGGAATFLTLTGTLGSVQISNNFFQPVTGENILNITADTSGGLVGTNAFDIDGGGIIFEAGSKTQTDPSWTYGDNTNLPDSTVTAEATLEGNTALTTIPAVNAWVIIEVDTSWAGSKLERADVGTDGTFISESKETVSLDLAGSVNLEPTGASVLLSSRFFCILVPDFTVTFTGATNTINETATTRVNGDIISFKNTAGTLPTGLDENEMYYVVTQATDSFQLSYTPGGAVIVFTGDGVPINTYSVAIAHGGVPLNSIAQNNPRSINPIGLSNTEEDGEIVLAVSNRTNADNINVLDAYYKIRK